MRKQYAVAALLLWLFTLSGCAGGIGGVPSPDYLNNTKLSDGKVPFTVDDLVNHIVCEIAAVDDAKDNPAPDGTTPNPYPPDLWKHGYVAQITLTLKVEDNVGLSPSLSFIHPYAVTGTSLTNLVDGNLNADRQRIYTTAFAIDMEKLKRQIDLEKLAGNTQPVILPYCANHGYFSLSGDLGIAGIITAGLTNGHYQKSYVAPTTANAEGKKSPSLVDVAVVLNPALGPNVAPNIVVSTPPTDPCKVLDPDKTPVSEGCPAKTANLPTFGSTVQFTILGSWDVGPTLSVKHFKGPSGTKGVLNGGETDTDTLVVAFAPKATTEKTKKALNDLDAAITELVTFNSDTAAYFNKHTNFRALSVDKVRNRLQANIDSADSVAAKTIASDDPTEAVATAQALTTNMILQNLNFSMPP